MIILVSFFSQQHLDIPFLSKFQLHSLIFNRARSITAIRNTIFKSGMYIHEFQLKVEVINLIINRKFKIK